MAVHWPDGVSGSKVDRARRKETFSSCHTLTQEPSEFPIATTSTLMPHFDVCHDSVHAVFNHTSYTSFPLSSQKRLPAFQGMTSLKPPWLPEPWPLNLIAKHILICINVAFAALVTSYGMELIMNVLSYFNTLYTALNCLWIAISTVDCKLLKWRNSSIRCS